MIFHQNIFRVGHTANDFFQNSITGSHVSEFTKDSQSRRRGLGIPTPPRPLLRLQIHMAQLMEISKHVLLALDLNRFTFLDGTVCLDYYDSSKIVQWSLSKLLKAIEGVARNVASLISRSPL